MSKQNLTLFSYIKADKPLSFLILLVAIIACIAIMSQLYKIHLNNKIKETYMTKTQMEKEIELLKEKLDNHTHDLPKKTGPNSDALVKTLEDETPSPTSTST